MWIIKSVFLEILLVHRDGTFFAFNLFYSFLHLTFNSSKTKRPWKVQNENNDLFLPRVLPMKLRRIKSCCFFFIALPSPLFAPRSRISILLIYFRYVKKATAAFVIRSSVMIIVIASAYASVCSEAESWLFDPKPRKKEINETDHITQWKNKTIYWNWFGSLSTRSSCCLKLKQKKTLH